MANYRILVLAFDGSLVSGHAVNCGDDQDACAVAETIPQAGEKAMIWEGARYVGSITVSPTEQPGRADLVAGYASYSSPTIH